MSDIRIGSMVMEVSGDGPAVVMVHGLGGTSNSFQTLLSALDGYRVLRPDLPGAGRSAYRPGSNSMDGLRTALQECLRVANIDRAHFVAHSMGTLLCQQLAVIVPDLVASLVLFGPLLQPPVAARAALQERAESARQFGMAVIADAVATASVGENNPLARVFVRESLMRQDPAGYAAHCRALSEAQAAQHDAIYCPTLLLVGEHDPVTPPAMAQELARRIDSSRCVTVPASGHWLMIEAVNTAKQALQKHLNEVVD